MRKGAIREIFNNLYRRERKCDSKYEAMNHNWINKITSIFSQLC